jgi:hypothetical protein
MLCAALEALDEQNAQQSAAADVYVWHFSSGAAPAASHRRLLSDVGQKSVMTTKHRIFMTSVASVYPYYVAKAEKKGRAKSEVDAIICWLTGYNQRQLEGQLKKQKDFETFFKEAPKPNPSRSLIKGVICGVRIEEIQERTMREIRYLDKLVDELAKGKSMDKILRSESSD